MFWICNEDDWEEYMRVQLNEIRDHKCVYVCASISKGLSELEEVLEHVKLVRLHCSLS